MLAVRRKCDVRKAASDLGRSDALAKLSDCQTAASDRETARCTLAIVCCESSLQSKCNVIRDEVGGAKARCWCNVIRYDVGEVAFDLERSDALARLSEYFVDWGFMRELVHRLDRKENEKGNEIRFQIIQANVVLRWITFWLWGLFLFSFIRFDFSRSSEVHVFVDWKSIRNRFHRSFWNIREIFFTVAIRIVLIIYWKV